MENVDAGIYLSSTDMITISDSNITNNKFGIVLDSRDSNVIKDSIIANNKKYGFYLKSKSESSNVYNNIFNNSINLFTKTPLLNNWNSGLSSNTNIVGLSKKGGNFWTNSIQSGFSNICDDINKDLICDNSYVIANSNIDNYPLATLDNVKPEVSLLTPKNNSFLNGVVDLEVDASDNVGIKNVTFMYTNSVISNKIFCQERESPYSCKWNTSSLLEESNGYNITIVAYDIRGNNNSKKYKLFIDKDIPYVINKNVVYPNDQSSIRNGQNVILKFATRDSDNVSSGINYSKINLTSLNSSGLISLDLYDGSVESGSWSYWKKNVTINTNTGNQFVNIQVADKTMPSANINSNGFIVVVDNENPMYKNIEDNSPIYNNEELIFSINAFDNNKLKKVIFSLNISDTWINESFSFLEEKSSTLSVSKILTTGLYNYKWYIFDDTGNVIETPLQNITVGEDRPEFTISTSSPNNGFVGSNEIEIKFNYTNGIAKNCSLFINNLLNYTWANITNLTDYSLVQNYSENSYSWYISCFDDSINETYLTDSQMFYIHITKPILNINSPINGTNYIELDTILDFTVTDDNIESCWYTKDSINYTIPGCENLNNIAPEEGAYYITVYAKDIAGLIDSKVINFTVDLDTDGDGIYDVVDSFEGDSDNIDNVGINNITMIVGNSSNLNDTYDEIKEVNINDGVEKLIQFNHNFTKSDLVLSNIKIIKDTNSLIVDLDNQLQNSSTKNLHLKNNNFIKFCVKDAEVFKISDISDNCDGLNETDFTSCLGNSTNVTINNITCIEEDGILKVSNLKHSGLKGILKPIDSVPTVRRSSSSGGGMSFYVDNNVADDSKENTTIFNNTIIVGKNTSKKENKNIIIEDNEVLINNNSLEVVADEKEYNNKLRFPIAIIIGSILFILLIFIIFLLIKHRRDKCEKDKKDIARKRQQEKQIRLKKEQEQKALQEQIRLKKEQENKVLQEQIRLKKEQEHKALQEQVKLRKEQEKRALQEQVRLKKEQEKALLEEQMTFKKQELDKRLKELEDMIK
jgi:hypothetical protein